MDVMICYGSFVSRFRSKTGEYRLDISHEWVCPGVWRLQLGSRAGREIDVTSLAELKLELRTSEGGPSSPVLAPVATFKLLFQTRVLLVCWQNFLFRANCTIPALGCA